MLFRQEVAGSGLRGEHWRHGVPLLPSHPRPQEPQNKQFIETMIVLSFICTDSLNSAPLLPTHPRPQEPQNKQLIQTNMAVNFICMYSLNSVPLLPPHPRPQEPQNKQFIQTNTVVSIVCIESKFFHLLLSVSLSALCHLSPFFGFRLCRKYTEPADNKELISGQGSFFQLFW